MTVSASASSLAFRSSLNAIISFTFFLYAASSGLSLLEAASYAFTDSLCAYSSSGVAFLASFEGLGVSSSSFFAAS